MQRRRPGLAVVKTPGRGSLDVRAIRLGTRGGIGATQETFANLIGVPVKTLRIGNKDGGSLPDRHVCSYQ